MRSLTKAQQQLFDWLLQYGLEQELSPSMREMMEAMALRSTSPIAHRLQQLHDKGYIEWRKEAKGRSRRTRIRILQEISSEAQGLPIQGTIAAGLLVEPFTDAVEYLDLGSLCQQPDCFVLRVTGDSMIEAHILEGDYAILRSSPEPQQISNGTVVAAIVQGKTTLKRFYRVGNRVTLKPENPNFAPIEVAAADLEIQGILVGVWRSFSR